jgi:hypothetical protein
VPLVVTLSDGGNYSWEGQRSWGLEFLGQMKHQIIKHNAYHYLNVARWSGFIFVSLLLQDCWWCWIEIPSFPAQAIPPRPGLQVSSGGFRNWTKSLDSCQAICIQKPSRFSPVFPNLLPGAHPYKT